MTSRSQFGAFIPFSAARVDEEAGVDTYIVRAMANNAVHLGDSFTQVRIATRPNTSLTASPSSNGEFLLLWQTMVPISVKEDGTSVALRWSLAPFVNNPSGAEIELRMVVAPTAEGAERDKDTPSNGNVASATAVDSSAEWTNENTPLTIPDGYVDIATTRHTNGEGFDVLDAWYAVQIWGDTDDTTSGEPGCDGIYLAEYMA